MTEFRPGSAGAWGTPITNTFESQPGTLPGSYRPIPSYIIPISFTTNTFAFWCFSNTARGTWFKGFTVSQKIGTTLPFEDGMATYSYRMIPHRKLTIVQFPPVPTEFFLELYFYWWYRNITVLVYPYQGVAFDPTTESLIDLIEATARIEGRLP